MKNKLFQASIGMVSQRMIIDYQALAALQNGYGSVSSFCQD